MPKIRLPFGLLVVVVIVGCASAAAPSSGPPGSLGSSPASTPAPTAGGVDQPTGATDVILRMEEGGGFAPIDLVASQAPLFTLYGDGRIVFQQLAQTFPEPGPDGITRPLPWRTGQLDPGQVDEVLTFALDPGGLGAARDSYIDNGIMDAPNTIFTIDAGGLKKTVIVNAIGMEPTGGPDDAARARFKRLADRLRDFDDGGTIASDVYAPISYRAVLVQREIDPAVPAPSAVPWPWPDLKLSDFKEGDGTTGPTFPHKTLTGQQVAALSLGDIAGGAQGLIIQSPVGETFSVTLRPLLPDETD
jgi:hypothetical protein